MQAHGTITRHRVIGHDVHIEYVGCSTEQNYYYTVECVLRNHA